MNQSQQDDEYENALDEATLWVSRIHTRSLSAEEKRLFSRWLNSNFRHQQAYDEMAATWSATSHTKDVPSFRAEAEYLSKRRIIKPIHIPFRQWATAAVILVFTSLIGLKMSHRPEGVPTEVQRYVTAPGEQRELTLEDGSRVLLNTRSQLEVAFSAEQRSVALLKGEAYFEVVNDANRPFLVTIDDVSVKAVGTAFNIYRRPLETLITIAEGIVKIKANREAQSIQVDARHQVRIGNHNILSVTSADLDAELAWQDKQMIFRDIPLNSVLKELNRYLLNPVSFNDSSLRQIKVSGTFDVREPEQMLRALLDSFNLVERQVRSNRVISTS